MTEANEGAIPFISVVGECCCGCGACVAACPVGCLSMAPNDCGFMYPAYVSGCIGCGRCEKACPVMTPADPDFINSVEWAKAADDHLRGRSSSGGVFGLLARDTLVAGGTIYGAAFTDDRRGVCHVRRDSVDGLDDLMRSKYVQSTVGPDVYAGVEGDLRAERRVLFSGTACQCAAMRNFLGLKQVPTDRLLLLDVICHGVPSPRLWAEWLDWVSREVGSEVDEVNFRSKSTGWLTFSVAYYVATEKVRSATNADDWYMKAFLNNAALRQSCLGCPAKRCCGSDVTLGDFWGIQNFHPEVVDRLGVSAVICNTEKGQTAIDAVRELLAFGPSSMEEVLPGNSPLVQCVQPYPKRIEFLTDIAGGMSVDDLMRKWNFEPTLAQKIRGKLSRLKHRLLK